jgi:hypothetical protein
MLRARSLLFWGDLGQIGQGHLGEIDIVWPIMFKLGLIDKHTQIRNCAHLWVTSVQRVKVIWGEIEKYFIDDNSRTIRPILVKLGTVDTRTKTTDSVCFV